MGYGLERMKTTGFLPISQNKARGLKNFWKRLAHNIYPPSMRLKATLNPLKLYPPEDHEN